MYTQIFFVTSVRGIFLPPQIAASESLRAFGAKIPRTEVTKKIWVYIKKNNLNT